MAKLKRLDDIWKLPAGQLVTVGNNRQIARDESGAFTCYLHGAPIVKARPHGASGTITIRLDACGYLTTTTIAAMRDFMAAFGVAGSASRAGGNLSARWHDGETWQERESSDGESMSFAAARNPVI
jgi:hypothetical protein